ncbi:hypothetical protein ACN6KF_003852 [Labrys sp. La1]|uniref:hypothetical protein n=1 Tax=Labrys sp. La1 TaxID=3404917 RepID=UPI003EC06839
MTNSSDTITAAAQVQDGPRGIGGWMILPIIGLVGTLVFTLINPTASSRNGKASRPSSPAATRRRQP